MGIRVEVKNVGPDSSRNDKMKAVKGALVFLRRQVKEAGILTELKQRAHFESKSEKRRRKKKECVFMRQKEKLRDYFG